MPEKSLGIKEYEEKVLETLEFPLPSADAEAIFGTEVPPSQEVRSHERYVKSLAMNDSAVQPTASRDIYAYSAADVAKAANQAAFYITTAREREIAKDLARLYKSGNNTGAVGVAAELLFGKELAASLKSFNLGQSGQNNYQTLYLEKQAEYLRREAEASLRILPHPGMSFFCHDASTYVFSSAPKNGQPQIAFYHIRDYDILKQVNGPISKLTGSELSNFYQMVHSHYRIAQTLYDQSAA